MPERRFRVTGAPVSCMLLALLLSLVGMGACVAALQRPLPPVCSPEHPEALEPGCRLKADVGE